LGLDEFAPPQPSPGLDPDRFELLKKSSRADPGVAPGREGMGRPGAWRK
jgi:hypothetical protein